MVAAAAGGRLLYVTCSVLRAENERVVGLRHPSDAHEQPIVVGWGASYRMAVRFCRAKVAWMVLLRRAWQAGRDLEASCRPAP